MWHCVITAQSQGIQLVPSPPVKRCTPLSDDTLKPSTLLSVYLREQALSSIYLTLLIITISSTLRKTEPPHRPQQTHTRRISFYVDRHRRHCRQSWYSIVGGAIQAAETMGVGITKTGRKVGDSIGLAFDMRQKISERKTSLSLWSRSDSSSILSHCTASR